MRVKIGPYIHRWTTNRFEHWWLEKHHSKPHRDVKDEELTKLDHFVDKVCDKWQTVLNATVNRYLDRKKRKVKIHIDGYDCWNADHTLGLIILPVLKKLQEQKHGSPLVDDEDVPVDLRSTAAPPCEDWETDDNVHKRWKWVMGEMIWAFEQLVNEEAEDQFHTGDIDIKWTPVDVNGNELTEDAEGIKYYRLDKGPNDTHIFDEAGFEAWNDRVGNGLKLFGKYYRGLWD
jgi:hypothetical protein